LQQSFNQNLPISFDVKTTELSVYTGNITPENTAKQVAKVKAAFPQIKPEFFSVLIDMMKENGFSDQRMIDSINNVIKTCQYPVPTMANFLSYDMKVKLYSYNEVCDMVTKSEAVFDDFCIVKVSGTPFRIRKTDKIKFSILDEY